MACKQLNFHDHLAAQASAPRPAGPRACAVARQRQQKVIDAATSAEAAARAGEIARIERELLAYIHQLGVGSQFQACDFIQRLWDMGCPPNGQLVDPRCTGGMFVSLTKRNHLRVLGYRANKGNTHTNYGSTARPVYIIDSLPQEKAAC